MGIPSLTTPEGLFDYLLWSIMLVAAIIGLVIAAVAFGFF